MVVLAGYKTVKEALVNNDDVFGDRYPLQLAKEFTKGHGRETNATNQYFSAFLFFPQL